MNKDKIFKQIQNKNDYLDFIIEICNKFDIPTNLISTSFGLIYNNYTDYRYLLDWPPQLKLTKDIKEDLVFDCIISPKLSDYPILVYFRYDIINNKYGKQIIVVTDWIPYNSI